MISVFLLQESKKSCAATTNESKALLGYFTFNISLNLNLNIICNYDKNIASLLKFQKCQFCACANLTAHVQN